MATKKVRHVLKGGLEDNIKAGALLPREVAVATDTNVLYVGDSTGKPVKVSGDTEHMIKSPDDSVKNIISMKKADFEAKKDTLDNGTIVNIIDDSGSGSGGTGESLPSAYIFLSSDDTAEKLAMLNEIYKNFIDKPCLTFWENNSVYYTVVIPSLGDNTTNILSTNPIISTQVNELKKEITISRNTPQLSVTVASGEVTTFTFNVEKIDTVLPTAFVTTEPADGTVELPDIGGSGSSIDKAQLLDMFYPIGSYYETSVASFDPNTEWGGTWVQDSKGLSTVGAYASDESDPNVNTRIYLKGGQVIGETMHTLTEAELARHFHPHRIVKQTWAQLNGKDATASLPRGISDDGVNLGWTSFVTGAGNRAVDYTGNDEAHNNTQPSIGVYRWHRTA